MAAAKAAKDTRVSMFTAGGGVPDADIAEQNSTILSKLKEFDVANAHCYDPNEELKLMRVIGAVGFRKFNEQIRAMAKVCIARSLRHSNHGVKRRAAKAVVAGINRMATNRNLLANPQLGANLRSSSSAATPAQARALPALKPLDDKQAGIAPAEANAAAASVSTLPV